MKAKLKDFFSVYYKLTFQYPLIREAASLTKLPLKTVIELINELFEVKIIKDKIIIGKINEKDETIVIEDEKQVNDIIDNIKSCSSKVI